MFGYLYPFNMPQLFDKCQIPDSKLLYEELILVLAKKALVEKIIPFDSSIINRYFGFFQSNEKNPLVGILLKRFAHAHVAVLKNDAIAESENDHRCGNCSLL